MQYLDFDLEVSAGEAGGYTVKVLRSPAGEATSTMKMPFTGLALQNNLQALQIALLRSGTTRRRIDTPESQAVQKFGQGLWSALFSGDILGRFEASRSEARRQDAGMRIKLRFDTPELAALPWEYLFDADRGDYVTLSASTPVVRYIPLPEAMAPLLVKPPLRILGIVISPSDLPALDVDNERQRLDTALAELIRRGIVELVWMPGGTTRDLQQMLWKGPWHVCHFIGHGGFDEMRGEGLVIFLDDAGKAQRVSATDLGRLLGDHDPLRLAVLNACEGARGDQADVFSSTAATLVRRGTPAVVAMQYEITDDAAIEFSRSFYEAVASGIAVDAALAEARKGIALAIPGTLEWGTPVLYMRAPDGVLFDIPSAPAEPSPAAEPAPPPPPPEPVAPEPAAAEPPPPEPPPPPHRTAEPAPEPVAPVVPVAAAAPPAAAAPSAAQPAAAPQPAPVPTPRARAAWTSPGGTGTSRRPLLIAIAVLGLLIVFFAVLGALASNDGGGLAKGNDGPGETLPGLGTASSGGGVAIPRNVIENGILFTNGPKGDEEIYRVDPEGGDPVALTSDHPADDRWPSWSPDGSHIAFTRVIDGDGDIYMMDADGQEMRRVTSGPANDWAPKWSPDGQVLVFNSNRNESTKSLNDLWTVRLDGSSDPTFLTGLEGQDDRNPAWWPIGPADGWKVVFSTDRDGNGRSLYLFDAFGNLTPVTAPGSFDRNPSWRPDGTVVVFSRAAASGSPPEESKDSDIWATDLVNGGETQLTTDSAQEGNPVFSPDGTRIVFYRMVGDDFHILVRDTAGEERDLTGSLTGDSRDPSWR